MFKCPNPNNSISCWLVVEIVKFLDIDGKSSFIFDSNIISGEYTIPIISSILFPILTPISEICLTFAIVTFKSLIFSCIVSKSISSISLCIASIILRIGFLGLCISVPTSLNASKKPTDKWDQTSNISILLPVKDISTLSGSEYTLFSISPTMFLYTSGFVKSTCERAVYTNS